MANLTPSGSNTVTLANAGGAPGNIFIPELWSDEIIAEYKRSLVVGNLVTKMPMTGKKGDTMHIPKPTRGTASLKGAATSVTLQQTGNDEVKVVVDKHYEYSRLIEDIVDVQALDSLRKFYTDDAGYALAKQMDDDIHSLGKRLGDGDGSGYVHSASFRFATDGSGTEPYVAGEVANVGEFSDGGFRDLIQVLDDNDVAMDGRVLVIPPSARNTIMGIDRYQSSDFVDGRGVNTGQIGTLYGIDVYVSTNCPEIETGVKAGMLFHKDAFVIAEQMSVRTQSQYKQEFLADLMTSDCLYGIEVLRPEAGVVLALPA